MPLPTPLDVTGVVEKTGGRSIYATENDLGPLFRAIAEEFRRLTSSVFIRRRRIARTANFTQSGLKDRWE
jgi:hypothetical protein